MNSDMLLDAMRSLALRWQDLAAVLERLADTFRQQVPSPRFVIAPGTPPVEKAIAILVGLASPAVPDSLRGRALAEASRVEVDIVALTNLPDRPTQHLLSNANDASANKPNGAIETFVQSLTALGVVETNRIPTPGFNILFGTNAEADPTVQQRACRDRITQLRDFIVRSLRSFRELQDTSQFTERFDIRGIRGSVDNLSAYPILTSEAGARGAPSGSAPSLRDTFSLRRVVQTAIRDVIGRTPKATDTKSFVTALNVSFNVAEIEGRTEYTWNPRSFAGQTDLGGGVTGGQASLATRAQVALDQALPLLDGLYALREDSDSELVNATRNIVRSEFSEVVGELRTEGGPRISRVDGLFEMLLTQPITVADQAQPVLGHLELLQYELGLTGEFVNTLDEENNFTNFIAVSDYIRSVETGWVTFRERLFGQDLGTRFVQLSRALSVAADSIGEIYDAMDSVFVGESERQVASFVHIYKNRPQRVFVGELLSWIAGFAAEEAPQLVREGGRRGVEATIPTTQRLRDLVARFLQALRYETDLPDGMRQPRVQNPVRELYAHLQRIERLATDVRQPA